MNFKSKIITACIVCSFLNLSIATPPEDSEEKDLKKEVSKELKSSLCKVSYIKNRNPEMANGAIVKMGEHAYIVINQHTLIQATSFEFKNSSGKCLIPEAIELSTNSDLARLRLSDPKQGFTSSDDVTMGSKLRFLSAEDSGSSAQIETCSIIGIGATQFEVDFSFSENQSGAPLLNEKDEIIGISIQKKEFSKTAMKEETRFAEDARYFCARVSKARWKPINWRKYTKTICTPYRDLKKFETQLLTLFKNKELAKLDNKKIRSLAIDSHKQAEMAEDLLKQRGLTDFLKNDLQNLLELFQFTDKYFNDVLTTRSSF